MPGTREDVIARIQSVVNQHYTQNSSPLLLSALGARLRDEGLWPTAESAGKTLREFIENARDSNLVILRDRNSPAYIAVATVETRLVVTQWMERRAQAAAVVPDLEALPRAVVLAFCVQTEPGQSVFLRNAPPFRYEMSAPEPSEREQFIQVDERYRRPGLKISDLKELHTSDRLDLQTRIAAWCKDKNVPIEIFYKSAVKKNANALERLLAAQPPGIAERLVIPGDIALLLARHD